MKLRIGNTYILFLLVIFILLTAIRYLFAFSMEHDECEQAILSQRFQLGYNQQPPLYTWIIILFDKAVNHILLSNIIYKNILFIGILYFTYKVAILQFKQPQYAFFSSASLLFFYDFTIESLGYTHTLMLIFAIVVLLWTIVRILHKQTYLNYTLLGFALAFGLLSKYNFCISVLGFFFATIMTKKYRRFVLTPKLLISIILMVLIISPHINWLLDHYHATTIETLEDFRGTHIPHLWKNKLKAFAELSCRIGLISAPFLIVVFIFFKNELFKISLKKLPEFSKFIGISIIASIGLLGLTILILDAYYMRTRWILPILLLVPLFVFSFLDSVGPKQQKQFRILHCLIYCFFLILILFHIGRITAATKIGYKKYINYPYAHFINYLNKQVNIEDKNIDLIITNKTGIAGNTRFLLKHYLVERLKDDCTAMYQLDLVQNPTRALILAYNQKDIDLLLKCLKDKEGKPLIIKEEGSYSHKYYYSNSTMGTIHYVIVTFGD